MEMVYGKHSVRAVFLKRPEDVRRVLLGGKPEYHADTIKAARRVGVEPELVAWPEFRRETGLTDDDKHQGVCVFTARRTVYGEHDLDRITIVSCGTSYHAGLLGRYAIEDWARLRVEVDVASEYRYRNPIVSSGDLVIGISQSGETADTLAAMRIAGDRGARVLALTNAMGSQATRDADSVLYTRSGLEVGVAATKTFVCQVAAMYAAPGTVAAP